MSVYLQREPEVALLTFTHKQEPIIIPSGAATTFQGRPACLPVTLEDVKPSMENVKVSLFTQSRVNCLQFVSPKHAGVKLWM